MANVVLPTILQGPAYISHAGVVIYTQGPIAISMDASSWNPETIFGPLGERHKSRLVKISFTPVGMVTAGLLNYFYSDFLTPTSIGASIIPGSGPTVVINDLNTMKTYTWTKGGKTGIPSLELKPTGTLFGSMEITALGDVSIQPTNAAFLKTSAGTLSSADTSFEESSIITDIYSAALGARSAPYSGLGGLDGFKIDFNLATKTIEDASVGIGGIYKSGLSLGVSFMPSNLTEAEEDALLALQDTGAVLPGQEYAKANEDLVITGTQVGWVFTAKQVGAKSGSLTYQIGEHRLKDLQFVNRRTWTTGVPVALFAYSAPA